METDLGDTIDSKSVERLIDGLNSDIGIIGVKAATGTGKSTKMIKELHDFGIPVIFVVEPTITAVENLGSYVSTLVESPEMVGTASEGNVQYHNKNIEYIRGDRRKSKNQDSAIVYATSGHVRRLMMDIIKYTSKNGFEDEKLCFCDILIIDEVHTGSVDNDVIMALYKYLRNSGANVPRVILSSATFDPSLTLFRDYEIFTFTTQHYPITVKYHSKDFKIGTRELAVATSEAILREHALQPLKKRETDAWLVFCSGANEVETIAKNLRNEDLKDVEIVVAYRNVGIAKMKETIYSPVPPGKRRIIIATNIVESAITVENLSGVFDTMTEKFVITSSSGGPLLTEAYVSKSSATQRAGRTGRMKPGFCYRMMTSETYNSLADNRPNEIERIPIYNIIMELLDAGIPIVDSFEGRITQERLDAALTLLKSLDMCRYRVSGSTITNFEITALGRFASRVPFSVKGAAIIYKYANLEDIISIYPILVVVAFIETYGPSYFWYPRKEIGANISEYNELINKHYEQYFRRFDGETNLHILLNIYNFIFDEFGSIHIPKWKLARFSEANSFNNVKIGEALRILYIGYNTLKEMKEFKHNLGVPISLNIPQVVKQAISIYENVYSDNIFTKTGGYNYVNKKSEYYSIDVRMPLRKTFTPPNSLIALSVSEVGSGKRLNRNIGLWVPLVKDLKGQNELFEEPLPVLSSHLPNTVYFKRQQSVNVNILTFDEIENELQVIEGDGNL